MAWQCSGSTNEELIDNMFKNGLITSERVRDAMKNVDRKYYTPSTAPEIAYADSPQSIGHAATISAPHMHASACEALLPYLATGNKVLDIGSGSGYLTAIFAELVIVPEGQRPGGTAQVVGLEHIPQLRDLGELNLAKSRRGKELLASGKVSFVLGDGRKGWKLPSASGEGEMEEEIWDAIHVGAAAKVLHPELVKQLKAPGRLFIPVEEEEHGNGQQWIWVVDKDANGVVTKKRAEGVRYVPLTDRPA
ncbi:protein-L-isoaspartate(D-aspartate) o-methyltransferase [Coleophoma cylindrospora]|uniref:protein-L-isoaspartate(D-aspartate) O-methyltransferase n=1 Tax=Coleophoma cylindrospora TaxID=1849047 RepID=A0A3D8R1T6_9HELO|nr:protein-L-isoaspartate(D-aspartate) o-methyltransferase [Coleophoma cylindrospora]